MVVVVVVVVVVGTLLHTDTLEKTAIPIAAITIIKDTRDMGEARRAAPLLSSTSLSTW